jgi:hypothetical protein
MKTHTSIRIPAKKPSFTKEELEELKRIHQKHMGEALSDTEAIEMGTRLVTLFRIIGKPGKS